MSDAYETLKALVEAARQGDQRAARELVEEWGSALRQIIRTRLSPALRPQVDPEDVEQAVWKSFFHHLIHEHSVESDEDLLAFLGVVARNKVVEAHRHCVGRARRGPRHSQPLDGPGAPDPDRLVSREPAPDQIALANDQWENLLEGSPIHHRPLLLMRREGHSYKAIAAYFRLNIRTVRRVFENARWRLTESRRTQGE